MKYEKVTKLLGLIKKKKTHLNNKKSDTDPYIIVNVFYICWTFHHLS